MLEMTFEEATSMIRLDAEKQGEKRGKKLGLTQGKKIWFENRNTARTRTSKIRNSP